MTVRVFTTIMETTPDVESFLNELDTVIEKSNLKEQNMDNLSSYNKMSIIQLLTNLKYDEEFTIFIALMTKMYASATVTSNEPLLYKTLEELHSKIESKESWHWRLGRNNKKNIGG